MDAPGRRSWDRLRLNDRGTIVEECVAERGCGVRALWRDRGQRETLKADEPFHTFRVLLVLVCAVPRSVGIDG
jgi:hypothetical protein